MTREKAKGGAKIEGGLSVDKLKEIWRRIKTSDWKALLDEHRPDNQWAVNGSKITGICVYHTERGPSLNIDTEKGFAHCFGCGKSEWNPIRFYQDISKLGFTGAVTDLKKRFNLKVITDKYARAAQDIEDTENLKNAIYQVCHQEFIHLIQDPNYPNPEVSPLYDPLRDFMRRRKYDLSSVHHWPVGVLPSRARTSELLHAAGLGEFVVAALAYLGPFIAEGSSKIGSIMYFNYLEPSIMGRIKIRVPDVGGRPKSFYFLPDPHTDSVGFFGLNLFSRLTGHLGNYSLYIVEGETDALALISNSMAVNKDDFCVISTSGSLEHSLQNLDDLGFKEICLIPDRDNAGTGWARSILQHNPNVRKVFLWPPQANQVKDIDEAFRLLPRADVFEMLANDENMLFPHKWAFRKFEEESEEIGPDDVGERSVIALRYAGCLSNSAEKDNFSTDIEINYGVEKHTTSVYDPEDLSLEELSKALVEKIGSVLVPIGKETTTEGEDRKIRFWSKRKKDYSTVDIKGSGNNLRTFLETELGLLGDYVKKEIGDVNRIQYRVTPKGPLELSTSQKNTELGELARLIITGMAERSQPLTDYREVGQGLHWVAEQNADPEVYIVNGKTFFKGTIRDGQISYSVVDTPKQGKILCKPDYEPWSEFLKTPNDIQAGYEYDPKDLFDDLFEILSICWNFYDQECMAQFVAADILYTPIAAIFERMVPIDIRGDYHSGKTTLMHFIGGKENRDYRACEATVIMDDYSLAGVKQAMNGKSLRLFLDEFENSDQQGNLKNGKRAQVTTDLLNTMRSIYMGIASVRGTAGGHARQTSLNFPLTVGGIYTMYEQRDLTRFIHVKTKFIPGFGDSMSKLRFKKAEEDMRKLRRGVTLCFLPRLQEIQKEYNRVREELSGNAFGPAGSITRIRDSIIPAATILKMAGQDYIKFIKDFYKVQEGILNESGHHREHSSVWNHVLQTQIQLSMIGISDQGNKNLSLVRIIYERDYRERLNDSDVGAYYFEDKKWLVIHWQKVLNSILKNSPAYRNATDYHRLKYTADEDPRVIKGTRVPERFIEDRVTSLAKSKMSSSEISIIDLTEDLLELSHETKPQALDPAFQADLSAITNPDKT